MSLSSQYKRQFGWRDWASVLKGLPPLHGQTVIDLGCGVGDLAAELVARGARVIGCDINEEFLREARSRQLSNAEFRMVDMRSLPDLGVMADGLWCSFTAAYFTDLPTALLAWARNLKSGGWIALTEIDDLFGHEPLLGLKRLNTEIDVRHRRRALVSDRDCHQESPFDSDCPKWRRRESNPPTIWT